MTNSGKTYFRHAAAWLIIGIALLAFAPLLRAAEPQTAIHPEPLTLGLKNGEAKAVAIRVEQAKDLYGLEFHLRFDPKIVRVQDADPATEGTQIESGNWLQDGFVATNQADNKRGTIDFAATLLNPAPALNGNEIVATIRFEALRDGSSALQVNKAILATRDAQEIQAKAQDGMIAVSASGQAPRAQANQNTNQNSRETAPQSGEFASNLLLLGAAGIGVITFVGALGLLLIVVLTRGRSRSNLR